ncbi:MAG: adenylate/guanylate cyclase domain-containing protein [Desulfobaccales bacterium]
MIRRLSSLFRSITFQLVTLVTLVAVLLVLFQPLFSEIMELKLYDLKLRVRGVQPAGPEVVIVTIDEDSLKALGRWPWSRDIQARLIDRIKEAGPKVVALDIIFAEKEETAAVQTIKNLRQGLTGAGSANPAILHLLTQEENRVNVDRQLAQAIAQGSPTLLGFFFNEVGSKAAQKAKEVKATWASRACTFNVVRSLDAKPATIPVLSAADIELNLPEISAASAGGGYFNMVPDVDGVVRWLPQAISFGRDIYIPLALAVAQRYLGGPPLILTTSQMGVEGVRLGDTEVPVDRFGRQLIDYYGPPGRFPYYSAAKVLNGEVPDSALKDKVVLVGATAVGIYDLRVTPFSGISPGVEIQATFIDNLIHRHFLQTSRLSPIPTLLTLLGLGLCLGLVLPLLSAAWSSVFALFLAGGYTTCNYLLFSRWGWQLELFYPLLAIGGIYMSLTVQRFLAEEKQRVYLKKAFQSYVAPDVVNEILKHPALLRLGGERRELTILFSDIRGFTSLSETMEPEVLVGLLHGFLNPMSEIIVTHGGTIDKYIGDAIMALFGAPLNRPDHPVLACRTALAMMAKLKALNEEWESQGRPVMRIGLGLNSGDVAVGNMGSDRLFNYTAIGDNVNLASRLEGLNKYYGTSILISSSTAQALDGQFVLREVDLVQVKGKAQALTIFELLGEGAPEPDATAFLEVYNQGLAFFREGRWQESAGAFTEALNLHPQDTPSKNYLELSEKFCLAPPGPEWTPVRVMDSK